MLVGKGIRIRMDGKGNGKKQKCQLKPSSSLTPEPALHSAPCAPAPALLGLARTSALALRPCPLPACTALLLRPSLAPAPLHPPEPACCTNPARCACACALAPVPSLALHFPLCTPGLCAPDPALCASARTQPVPLLPALRLVLFFSKMAPHPEAPNKRQGQRLVLCFSLQKSVACREVKGVQILAY
ncbi:hypothetical protein SLEP1_g49807 [Rubroshorea leprosula]|uniref:Uncharacterized protein n=1 Tax=Rubroshorea leprosula TaxID=152421 RepID=A0AAV5M021_9ROSI|nr:hypothetical protein SLEP1_g49807 [Rubroshorea leprosula]